MKEKQKQQVIPVLLAGGVGSRLWPVSRESYPKQFCNLFDELSLLQNTAEMAKAVCESSEFIVVTNDNYYFLCKNQLEIIEIFNAHYILEPCAKNTAPAIALSAKYAMEYIDDDAILLVLPSDQHLQDHGHFKNILKTAIYFAQQNQLVVFGVKPTAPKTGYGYIEKGDAVDQVGFKVNQFVEKPSLQIAKTYLAQGNFYWNSGMFLFKAKNYLNELQTAAPDIYTDSLSAYSATARHPDFFRVSDRFSACREGSIDYEVMEKTKHAIMLPLEINWNDLGCWSSVGETATTDTEGNTYYGNVMIDKCENSLISSDGRRVVAIGIKNQVVVSTSDAVLVIDKAYTQEVKTAVAQMRLQQDSVATEHKRIYRPWGFYEKLSAGPNYQVKYLMVSPGAKISLQLHHFRSEHWVVVSGEAEVVNGEKIFRLYPNHSIYIEKGTKHCLKNIGLQPLIVIEVQSGEYLGEDDIVRLDDLYGREKKAELT